jgi:chromosome segregation ATPase
MTAEQYIHSYTTLFQNHPQLYSQNIEVVFSSVITLKVDIFGQLERAREQIDQLQRELERTQADYRERDEQLQQALAKITAMEASKFWKLRRVWIKGKKIFRRDWQDPIYS